MLIIREIDRVLPCAVPSATSGDSTANRLFLNSNDLSLPFHVSIPHPLVIISLTYTNPMLHYYLLQFQKVLADAELSEKLKLEDYL